MEIKEILEEFREGLRKPYELTVKMYSEKYKVTLPTVYSRVKRGLVKVRYLTEDNRIPLIDDRVVYKPLPRGRPRKNS